MSQQTSNSIDFLIIGAQKAGTTSLFEYMRGHPQIHMPPEKEISFFSRNYERGLDWYLATMLRDAPPSSICGEASMGYMGGTPFANITQNEIEFPRAASENGAALETVIPMRIKQAFPEIRLACVLRDPAARAYSHYQMAVLEKAESRSFDQAVDELLTQRALEQARAAPTTTNGYIVNGEYGRLIAGFLDVFPREQMLVLFSNELSDSPIPTLQRLFGFIGVRPDFIPDNLDTRYRAAATKRRVSWLDLYAWQDAVAKSILLRRLWHGLPAPLHSTADRTYRVAGYRVAMWNAHRGAAKEAMSEDAHAKLIEHFRADSQALGALTGLQIPWLEKWSSLA